MEKSSKLKLGFVFAIFLIFIVAVNPASSAFFGLFEDPVTNVTVDGIDFNIPSGYEFDERFTNLTYAMSSDDFKEKARIADRSAPSRNALPQGFPSSPYGQRSSTPMPGKG